MNYCGQGNKRYFKKVNLKKNSISLSVSFMKNIFTALLCQQTAFFDGKVLLCKSDNYLSKATKLLQYFYLAEYKSCWIYPRIRRWLCPNISNYEPYTYDDPFWNPCWILSNHGIVKCHIWSIFYLWIGTTLTPSDGIKTFFHHDWFPVLHVSHMLLW